MTKKTQDRNFRRQFLKMLTFGLIERFKIRERMRRIVSTISRKRRVSFRNRNQVKDLGATSKNEEMAMKVVLTHGHRAVTLVCKSRSVHHSQDSREETATAV